MTRSLTDPPSAIPPELEHSIDTLSAEFRGIHAPKAVARVVVDSYDQLSLDARIPTYLPLLATRFARERLTPG